MKQLPVTAFLCTAMCSISLASSSIVVAQEVPAQELPAQESPPVFEERVEVRVMELAVVVESLAGNPIAGLTASDFRVREDGEVREIVDIQGGPSGGAPTVEQASPPQEASAGSLPAPSSPRQRPARPRALVLAFDLESIRLPELSRAMPQLRRFVEEAADPALHWSVLLLGREPYAVTSWSTDAPEIVDGLERVVEVRRGVPTSAWALGSFLWGSEPVIPFDPASLLAAGGAGARASREMATDDTGLDDFLERLRCARVSIARSVATAVSLERLVSSLRAPGEEVSVVLFYAADPTPAPASLSADCIVTAARGKRIWEGAALRASSAGIRVHAADLTGLNERERVEPYSAASVGLSPRGGSRGKRRPLAGMTSFRIQEGTALTAEVTGGRDVESNAWDAGPEYALEAAANEYVLTLAIPHPADGEEHRLEVDLEGHPGVRLRFRRRYVDLSPRQRLELELAGSGNVPRSGGGFPLELEVRAEPAEQDDQLNVAADLSAPLGRLGLIEAEDGSLRGSVVAYLAVYAEDGTRLHLEQAERALEVPSGPTPGDLDAAQFRHAFRLELPAGTWTVVGAIYDGVDDTSSVATERIFPD